MSTKYIVNNSPDQTINGNMNINGSINFSDGGGTWSFGATAVSFPDNTVQTTAYASKYKVYTALLTQSGTSSTQSISSGNLTLGVTYTIGIGSSFDFTNVGAPNNDNGTRFVATGITPTSWGSGTLTFNTGAPVVTILENTIGNIVWTYESLGSYRGTLSNTFRNNYGQSITSIFFGGVNGNGPGVPFFAHSSVAADFVVITTQKIQINALNLAYNYSDDALNSTSVEIRVYN